MKNGGMTELSNNGRKEEKKGGRKNKEVRKVGNKKETNSVQ
jgi:hypothetical protein